MSPLQSGVITKGVRGSSQQLNRHTARSSRLIFYAHKKGKRQLKSRAQHPATFCPTAVGARVLCERGLKFFFRPCFGTGGERHNISIGHERAAPSLSLRVHIYTLLWLKSVCECEKIACDERWRDTHPHSRSRNRPAARSTHVGPRVGVIVLTLSRSAFEWVSLCVLRSWCGDGHQLAATGALQPLNRDRSGRILMIYLLIEDLKFIGSLLDGRCEYKKNDSKMFQSVPDLTQDLKIKVKCFLLLK